MDNKELIGRRRFFKKAAKGLLPMLGFAAFGPSIFVSCSKDDGCSDCSAMCSSNCTSSCQYSSSGGCSGCSSTCSSSSTSNTCSSCANDCSSSCKDECQEGCSNTCKTTCSNSCEGIATGKSTTGSINGHDYVDLGLSVLWATYNIGAKKFYSFGDYFAFADTNGKIVGDNSIDDTYYNQLGLKEGICIAGTSKDIAFTKWGRDWRLPTRDEIQELTDNCKLEYSYYNDEEKHDGSYRADGIKFISKINNNSIFLPFAGVYFGKERNDDPYECNTTGFYWSGDVTSYGSLLRAFCLLIDSDKYAKPNAWIDGRNLNQFQSVRPVADRNKGDVSTCNGTCTANCSSDCSSTCKNSCGNNCTGGCKGKCTQTCADSCSSDCTSSCSSGCSSTCKGTCSGGCSSGCSSGCKGTCSGGCGSGCSGGCSGCSAACKSSCEYGCVRACSNDCSSSCTGGCDSTCSGTCVTTCTGTCYNTCNDTCFGSCRITCEGWTK